MSMFRQCRRVHTTHETLELPGSKRCANTLEFRAASNEGTVELSPKLQSLSTFISHIRGDHSHEHKNDSRRYRAVAVVGRVREEGRARRGCAGRSCNG